MSDASWKILTWAYTNGMAITTQQAVDLVGHRYYCNERKHTGNLLSALVRRGYLLREKPGHFKLVKFNTSMKGKALDQPELF